MRGDPEEVEEARRGEGVNEHTTALQQVARLAQEAMLRPMDAKDTEILDWLGERQITLPEVKG